MSAEGSQKSFFDTNILVYRTAHGDRRQARARDVMEPGGLVSVQILNEFVNVSRKKLKLEWEAIEERLELLRDLCGPVMPLTDETHRQALMIAGRYGYTIYDAMAIASALLAGCKTLYSEDMQDGQRIDLVTIRNPFKAGG